jgi:hypothetical protein
MVDLPGLSDRLGALFARPLIFLMATKFGHALSQAKGDEETRPDPGRLGVVRRRIVDLRLLTGPAAAP